MSTEPEPLHLAIIVASTREGRFAPVVRDWFVALAEERDEFTVDVVDLDETELPSRLSPQRAPETQRYAARIDAADAIVVITTEYNHSYPASIKQAIDLIKQEWFAKPVAFVSYGGISGGLRAVEHLRGVFAEVHAITIRDTVSFHFARTQFDEDGQPLDREEPAKAAHKLLEKLAWWARPLREARRTDPYEP